MVTTKTWELDWKLKMKYEVDVVYNIMQYTK